MIARSLKLRRRTAFTLVELLVVISIIGMLMALLFQRSRDRRLWRPRKLVTGAAVTLMGKTTTVAAQVPNPGPMVYTSQDYITVHDGSSLTLMLSENNYAPWPWLIQTNGPGISSGQTYNGASFWGPSLSVAPPYAAGTEIQNCFVFWPDAQPTSCMKINSPAPTRALAVGNQLFQTMTPSSNHPTGVNVSFCDGPHPVHQPGHRLFDLLPADDAVGADV